MAHFIQLTRKANVRCNREEEKIMVNIEQVCFYYDQCLFFNDGSMGVKESFDEITNLINKARRDEA